MAIILSSYLIVDLALVTCTCQPKHVALGSSVQAFPKCFCALLGIIQLDHMDFVFMEIPDALTFIHLCAQLLPDHLGLHCSVPSQSCLPASFAPINKILPLLTPKFPLLCSYCVLKFPYKAELFLSSADSSMVHCLSAEP